MTKRSEYPFIIPATPNKWGPGKSHGTSIRYDPIYGKAIPKPLCRDYVRNEHNATRIAPTKYRAAVTCKKCLALIP